ncbi:MAG: cation transporter [Anaerolineales bacterium]|nr:cation transporter [Anaerolineales bacterium]
MTETTKHPPTNLSRYGWLSIATAVVTIGLKFIAYLLSGSVGLLSDALESIVNLVTAVTALCLITIARRPPDEDHAYGHAKAEYFASMVTGGFITVASGSILYTAVLRLLNPEPLEQVGLGVLVSLGAAVVNLVVSRILIRAGRQHRSPALEAEGKHLQTDVITSGGVAVGLGLVWLTGWVALDSVIALIVGAQIGVMGLRLLYQASQGLMDSALPAEEQAQIHTVLQQYEPQGVTYHALRTRQAGQRRFVSVHLEMPGDWTVQKGHLVADQIEADLRQTLPDLATFTHLEPKGDPLSHADRELWPLA